MVVEAGMVVVGYIFVYWPHSSFTSVYPIEKLFEHGSSVFASNIRCGLSGNSLATRDSQQEANAKTSSRRGSRTLHVSQC